MLNDHMIVNLQYNMMMAVYSEKMYIYSLQHPTVQDPKNLSAFNNYVINWMMVH